MPWLILGLLALGGLAVWEWNRRPPAPITVSPGQTLSLTFPVGTTFNIVPPGGQSFAELSVSTGNINSASNQDASGNFFPNVGTFRAASAGSTQIQVSYVGGQTATVNVTAQ